MYKKMIVCVFDGYYNSRISFARGHLQSVGMIDVIPSIFCHLRVQLMKTQPFDRLGHFNFLSFYIGLVFLFDLPMAVDFISVMSFRCFTQHKPNQCE